MYKSYEDKNYNSESRITYIDIFRSFGIILMIMGHIWFGYKFDFFIHAFHMPMFFFISGFFYKPREISFFEEVKRKAKNILIPYFYFGLLCYAIEIIRNGITLELFKYLLAFNTVTNGIPIAGALWFLTALFFTDIIFFILDKNNCKWIIIPLILIGSFADQLFAYPLPWALSASFVGLGLYWCGYTVKQYERKFDFLLNMSWWCILIFGLVTTGLIFLNGYINMREGKYSIIPLFWFNALMAIFIGISVSKYVIKIKIIKQWLTSIGANSIVYLCMNQLVILIVSEVLYHLGISGATNKIIVLATTMIVLYFASLLFTKTKLKVVIGKF